jgi:hypothetical protein
MLNLDLLHKLMVILFVSGIALIIVAGSIIGRISTLPKPDQDKEDTGKKVKSALWIAVSGVIFIAIATIWVVLN